MFREYEKTFHIPEVTSKFNLDKVSLQRLLAGKVVVEEKMDGTNVGIIRHSKGFALQKRHSLVGPSEHEQFNFFHRWAYEFNFDRLMALPKDHLVYGEFLYATHTIRYTGLPDYFLAFDIRYRKFWLDYEERMDFCKAFGLHTVPTIAYGNFTKLELLDMIPPTSVYGPVCEGVVVKRYAKNGYFKGKIVRPEFRKIRDEDLAPQGGYNLLKQ